MKIAITGHQPPRLCRHEKEIGIWIDEVLTTLQKKEHITAAYTGMAQGADQLFAIKAINHNIPLYCTYPYRRTKFHPHEEMINAEATAVEFISERKTPVCYHIRDCYMVDSADVLIAIWDGVPEGGTFDTIQYARKSGVPIVYCLADVIKYGVDINKYDKLREYAQKAVSNVKED